MAVGIKFNCKSIGNIYPRIIYTNKYNPIYLFLFRNIFIDNNGEIKLADFGISKLVLDTIYTTKFTLNVGTIYYMSPEMLANLKYDESVDIW